MILSRFMNYFHLLDAHEFIYGWNIVFNFQAKCRNFPDFFQDILNRIGLGVATFQRRYGCDVCPVFALLD